MVGQSTQHAKSLHNELIKANLRISEEKQNTDDIASTLKRDYVKMETDLSGKIDDKKTEVELLQEKLANTQAELRREKAEKAEIIREKDEEIGELQYKINHMETAFENILHDAFDLLADRVASQKDAWEKEAMNIQSKNKKILMEFGLNPLHF